MTNALATLLRSLPKGPAARSFARYEADEASWCAIASALGDGQGEFVSLWGDRGAVHLAFRFPGMAAPVIATLAVAAGEFPSVGRHHPAAIRMERAIHDVYGHRATDAPDERSWLDHGAWGVAAPLGAATTVPRDDPAGYGFQTVEGKGLHIIPVGPVHAGVIEPGHFRFTANGETVLRLEARLGYVHKGIDGLLEGADLARAARIVARISGDETVALSFAFALAVEDALGVVVPPRAQALRGVIAELERLANHFGDIGAICNDATFTLIHAHCGIFRERVLAACDHAFGHRLMMDRIVPGGVTHDLSVEAVRDLLTMLSDVAPLFAEVVHLYDETPSLQDRTCGTGIVSADLVTRWAAGGYIGRASGRDVDMRRDLAYGPYRGLALEVPVLTTGDVDGRVRVRILEVEASLRLLRGWLSNLPTGPIMAEFAAAGAPREGGAMVESFRGDLFVWLALDGDGKVTRCHVRDPSWLQWPLMEAAIKDNIVADFPLCNKSFNCSYSGHDL